MSCRDQRMRVLVTGASGLLGRGTALALQRDGHDVTVLQRRPSGLDLRERLGDISDVASVREAVRGMDAVVHLAAKVHVIGDWKEYLRINVDGTRGLLDAASAAGVGRFVQASSPSVAHAGASLVGAPAGHADPESARGDYARSKAMAERIALAANSGSMSVVAVRPHLVWGPGDTQLVGRIVSRARAGRLALVGAGTALVDTTYIDNAVDAFVAAVDRAPAVGGRAFVVTNGEPRAIAEIIIRICDAAGVPGPSRRVPFRLAWLAGAAVDTWWGWRGKDQDPPMTRFLAEQLATAHWFEQETTRSALGWAPQVSLEEGFARLARSFETQPRETS